MPGEAGKGSNRRKEFTKAVEARLAKVDWSKRDKGKDTFLVKVNGKVVKNG